MQCRRCSPHSPRGAVNEESGVCTARTTRIIRMEPRMKKYYINMRNGKAAMFYLPVTLLCYLYFLALTVYTWSLFFVIGILMLLTFALLLGSTWLHTICMFTNYFCYNSETDEIILKRFRHKDRVIALSSIEKIVIKGNEDPALGAVGGRKTTSFAVKSREGYDYFYIPNDPILEKFFADHGIPTLRYYEEES